MLPPLHRHSASLFSAFALLFALDLMAAENPPAPSPDKSSGKFNITLFNQTLIQLYGLHDVEISTNGDRKGETPVCVASNVSKYRISMTSSTEFKLKLDANEIDYILTLKKNNQQVGTASWGQGQLKSGAYAPDEIERDIELHGPNPVQADCGDSAHQIEVSVPDIAGKPSGTYSDVVTVTVAPI